MELTQKNILIFFLIVTIFALLYLMSGLIIPLCFGLIAALIFQPIVEFMKKIHIPKFLIFPIVMLIVISMMFAIYSIISISAIELIINKEILLERLSDKLDALSKLLYKNFKIRIEALFGIESIFKLLSSDNIKEIAGSTASIISSLLGSFALFMLYFILFLLGLGNYKLMINKISSESNSQFNISIFEKIKNSILYYIVLKLLISIFTGICVFIICISFGVSLPYLFAFITILLNFIPNIGSMVATILPFAMALIELEDPFTAVIMLIILIVVQFIVGNFIEPKIVGNRLSLNTITVISGLVFWGYLWGISGMLLSVPLLVFMKIVFEQYKSTSIIAKLMGSFQAPSS